MKIVSEFLPLDGGFFAAPSLPNRIMLSFLRKQQLLYIIIFAQQNRQCIVQLDSLTLKMELGTFYLGVGEVKRVLEVDLNHLDKLEEIAMFLVYIINDIPLLSMLYSS